MKRLANLFSTLFSNASVLALYLLIMAAAIAPPASATKPWDGPTTGPAKQAGKKVVYISEDLKNGGISANYRGFYTAVEVLGWQLTLVNGNGDRETIRNAFADAIRTRQDAIVLGGFQPDELRADSIASARRSNIVLVGWHAAAEPGPTKDLFINIATESAEVARKAAEYVTHSTTEKIGVIIFNDNRFAVANAKTRRMKEIIDACKRCRVLAVENILISNAAKEIPLLVPVLNKTYGRAWTHTLAINDVYFDAMNVPLISIGREDIQNISAGDGSNIALGRIRSGTSQQVATVAEPAGLQGWQLADELNRAFAGAPPSGYVSKPVLVTSELLKQIGGAGVDFDIPYREMYSAIWQGKPIAR